jgi:hypothetical protein
MGEKLGFLFVASLFLLLSASGGRADLPIGLHFEGQSGEDFFGASVAGAGDVNGDGVPDIIVGAPQADPGGRTNAGSAFVFSGANGAQLFRFEGQAAGDGLGYPVASAGDVNGDGVPDIIVGATGADPGGRSDAGSAFVFSGKNGTQLLRSDGEAAGDMMGSSVASAGDVNDDGAPDIIVGAPGADPGGRSDAGSVFVFSGANGARLFRFDGEAAGDMLGFSAASAGDADGDGVPDFVVGAPGVSVGGIRYCGSAFIFSGANGALLRRFDGSGSSGCPDCLGFSVAGAGDVNDDGKADVIVGAPGADCFGEARVFSAVTSYMLRRLPAWIEHALLGYSVAGAGDVNGDGVADFVVGAPGISVGATPYGGSGFVYSGITRTGFDPIRRFDGPAEWDRLGSSVAGAGDLNGDGLDDVIIGAIRWHPSGAPAPGAAWVVTPFGPSVIINPPPIPGGAIWTNNPTVQLLLPVVGAATMEFAEPGGAWVGPYAYEPRRTWTFSRDDGTRRLYARYRDFSGNVMAEVFDDIILDLTAPAVAIQSPPSGALVRGVVTVRVNAADQLSGVASVMFFVDGAAANTDTAVPYEWGWDTRPSGVAVGPHTIVARALDKVGNSREATITVTVDKTVSFADVSIWNPFWQFIEALYSAGVTSGCKSSAPRYCPYYELTRGQMAKLICKAAGKSALDRPTPTFTDVPKTHIFYGWIEGVMDAASWGGNPPVSGCTETTYCPDESVTRGEMAKILCTAVGKTSLSSATPTFYDVPTWHPYYGWIERLADPGSWTGRPPTSGCGTMGSTRYFCPGRTVKRGDMAQLVALAFGLAY